MFITWAYWNLPSTFPHIFCRILPLVYSIITTTEWKRFQEMSQFCWNLKNFFWNCLLAVSNLGTLKFQQFWCGPHSKLKRAVDSPPLIERTVGWIIWLDQNFGQYRWLIKKNEKKIVSKLRCLLLPLKQFRNVAVAQQNLDLTSSNGIARQGMF